ncbi:MAG: hypothetical protein ACFB6S_14910 [Geminicoccaceae bacterium]
MSLFRLLLGLGILVAVVSSLTLFKLHVDAQRKQLARLQADLIAERAERDRLRADLAFLQRSETLFPEAEALGMVPLTPSKIVEPGDLPDRRRLLWAREPRLVQLETGETIALRLRPTASQRLGAN